MSSLEICGFWLVLWLHRRNALQVLKEFRSNQLVAIGIPLVLVYAVTLGKLCTSGLWRQARY